MSSQIANVIRELEQRLLERSLRSSPTAVTQLIADDFREFGTSGRVYDKSSVIAALAMDKSEAPEVLDFEVFALGPDLALATYRTVATIGNGGEIQQSLRSSIWCHRSGRWQIRFHQGTQSSS